MFERDSDVADSLATDIEKAINCHINTPDLQIRQPSGQSGFGQA